MIPWRIGVREMHPAGWRTNRSGRRRLSSNSSRHEVCTVLPALPVVRLLQLILVCSVAYSHGNPHLSEDFGDNGSTKTHQGKRLCLPNDLVPDYEEETDLSRNWDDDTMIKPPFDCTCNTLKASYFCPNLGDGGYPKWVPRVVADGECHPVSRNDLKHEPFPAGFKILFYGNSHLRQVVEGIVCAFSSAVKHRRLTMLRESEIAEDVLVEPEVHCRSCINNQHSMLDVLEDYGCVGKHSDACRCDDDNSVFEFNNGAMLHYHFAHKEEGKRIEDALRVHGTRFSDYDAVVANLGNEPRMETSEVLRSASTLKDEGVPLFWLSSYEGAGDIRDWTREEQKAFKNSGAKFLPVHDMVESLRYLTKGVIEGEYNPHFCMPGPPNEIGILLLKISWAFEAERERQR